ncbi:unnamed protein product [marine sediment metagenome]|uniref:Secreted protein n=1 Tax=marine sediment metagenome TaxID=412755 RepID=X1RQP8_9ZZZZ
METYILILTLIYGQGGGVTTLEIDGVGMCGTVGRNWVEHTNSRHSFYTCVKKPIVY